MTGISLGGITSALAAAVDPTLNRGVFLLAGGGLDEILWEMDEPEARRYRKQWLASGRTRADLKALTTPLDPLTYADRLVGKKILMMAGNVDEVVPPASARALWEAVGPAADPLVRLRPLLGGRLPAARPPRGGRLLRGRGAALRSTSMPPSRLALRPTADSGYPPAVGSAGEVSKGREFG